MKLKPPRILNLLAESRPEDAEVKSEAAFQRLVASVSELPAAPRTPRTFTDRGRYPEEAGQEENTREDSPSDDEEPEAEEGTFAFSAPPPSATQPINIMKPRTRAGSINGDDAGMSISETSSSFGAIVMDVDGVSVYKYILCVVADVYRLQPLGSPLLPPNSINQWRYTPPPTTSAVRSNKRKRESSFSSGIEELRSLTK